MMNMRNSTHRRSWLTNCLLGMKGYRAGSDRYQPQINMASKPYLIFDLDDSQYGIDASLVKEIFPLPELTPVPEAPPDIIGILNLRGEVLPIMHLGLRLGRSTIAFKLSDQCFVCRSQGNQARADRRAGEWRGIFTGHGASIRSHPGYFGSAQNYDARGIRGE
jgi:CheW-like domain